VAGRRVRKIIGQQLLARLGAKVKHVVEVYHICGNS
jgi:hypothetical protein